MTTAAFTDLAAEFNATAQSYLRAEVPVTLLLAKYSAIVRYKTETPDDRQTVVSALYNCSLQWLDRMSAPKVKVESEHTAAMSTLFSRLMDADSICLLPETAPARLADASLTLLRAAEKQTEYWPRTYLIKMAEQALEFADTARAAHDAARADVTTSQDIEPAKKIALKKKDDTLSL